MWSLRKGAVSHTVGLSNSLHVALTLCFNFCLLSFLFLPQGTWHHPQDKHCGAGALRRLDQQEPLRASPLAAHVHHGWPQSQRKVMQCCVRGLSGIRCHLHGTCSLSLSRFTQGFWPSSSQYFTEKTIHVQLKHRKYSFLKILFTGSYTCLLYTSDAADER